MKDLFDFCYKPLLHLKILIGKTEVKIQLQSDERIINERVKQRVLYHVQDQVFRARIESIHWDSSKCLALKWHTRAPGIMGSLNSKNSGHNSGNDARHVYLDVVDTTIDDIGDTMLSNSYY